MMDENIHKKPVAVLGGGACAQAFAAEFSLAGYRVHLYELPEFAPETLGPVLETHEIKFGGRQLNFQWFSRRGVAQVDVVTTDMSTALENVGVIIIAIPAKGHKSFFERMIPYLEDGQIISIFPDNFGSLRLKRMMHDAGCDADVLIGGWSSMPYGVRVIEPGKLDCILRTREILGDSLPSKNGEIFYDLIKEIPAFDGAMSVRRGDTIIGVGLSNPNPVVHVPGSILNVGAMEVSELEGTLGIEPGKYSMYKHGMSPAISRVQFAYYKEEKSIAKELGIEMVRYREDQFFWKASIMGIEYWVPFADAVLPPIIGPNSVEHRYFTEDIPVGTVIRYHLAQKLKIEVPVMESLIRLGSLVCNQDFFKTGVTLEELGIQDLSKEEITTYIREGR